MLPSVVAVVVAKDPVAVVVFLSTLGPWLSSKDRGSINLVIHKEYIVMI